jgi:gluconate 2-dehydrogenase gamma chain
METTVEPRVIIALALDNRRICAGTNARAMTDSGKRCADHQIQRRRSPAPSKSRSQDDHVDAQTGRGKGLMSKVDTPHRRIFLKQVAAAVGVAPLRLGPAALGIGAATATVGAIAQEPIDTTPAFHFFNGDEARTAEAAVARLIPADDNGPGAKEAGVAVFIDLQLASAWGSGDHLYRQGPYIPGSPQQGYQLAFTPAEMFRLGFAKLDESARKAHGAAFANLTFAQQDALLTQCERGELDFGALPSAIFFGALLDATMEGFFSDPIHGGNRDKIGWKLVGFPGVHASYANDIERHNVPWTRPPASIADTRT